MLAFGKFRSGGPCSAHGQHASRAGRTPGSALQFKRYEARAFRCGFDRRVGCCGAGVAATAGACAAARVGPLPRQKLMVAAAMTMLE